MKNIKILIVEDEFLVSKDIQRSLENLNYNVVGLATNANDALEIIKVKEPDIVITNVNLNGLTSGIELASEINQKYDIGVIFVSAHADEEILNKAKKAHPLGYLLKPFSLNELKSTVEMAVNIKNVLQKTKSREKNIIDTLSSLDFAVIITDLKGIITFINNRAEEILAWSKNDAIGEPIKKILITEIDKENSQAFTNPIKQGKTTGNIRLILHNKYGKKILIEEKSTSIKNHHGDITGILIQIKKITSQKNTKNNDTDTEAKQEPSKSGLLDKLFNQKKAQKIIAKATDSTKIDYKENTTDIDSIYDSISLPIVIIDEKWKIFYTNQSSEKILPISKKNTDFWENLPAETIAKSYNVFFKTVTKFTPHDTLIKLKNNQNKFQAFLYPLKHNDKNLIFITLQKDKSQKQISKQVKHDKLEYLNLLGRGFAHEFYNNLTSLYGLISLIDNKRKNKEYDFEISQIKKILKKDQNLVQQLLTFTKGGKPAKIEFDALEFTNDFISEYRKEKSIKYLSENKTNQKKITLLADPNQIKRLLTNFVTNAEQAILEKNNQKGTISISINEIVGDSPEVNTNPKLILKQDYIKFTIEDDGVGIDENRKKNIFEPFYTSKKENIKASGIGLTVCQSIVEQHHGFITFDSKTQKGTTITAYIPKNFTKKQTSNTTKNNPQNTKIIAKDISELLEQNKNKPKTKDDTNYETKPDNKHETAKKILKSISPKSDIFKTNNNKISKKTIYQENEIKENKDPNIQTETSQNIDKNLKKQKTQEQEKTTKKENPYYQAPLKINDSTHLKENNSPKAFLDFESIIKLIKNDDLNKEEIKEIDKNIDKKGTKKQAKKPENITKKINNRKKYPHIRILILEDDFLLRRLMFANLKKYDFQVDEAEKGETAIELYKKAIADKKPYDLYISDLHIKDGMSGQDAIIEILKIDPNVKAIVSSAYFDTDISANYKKYGFSANLPKPYQPQTLIDTIAKILKLS